MWITAKLNQIWITASYNLNSNQCMLQNDFESLQQWIEFESLQAYGMFQTESESLKAPKLISINVLIYFQLLQTSKLVWITVNLNWNNAKLNPIEIHTSFEFNSKECSVWIDFKWLHTLNQIRIGASLKKKTNHFALWNSFDYNGSVLVLLCYRLLAV